jgi:hypothetical protein
LRDTKRGKIPACLISIDPFRRYHQWSNIARFFPPPACQRHLPRNVPIQEFVMKLSFVVRMFVLAVLFGVVAWGDPGFVSAQKAPTPIVLNPQAPTLKPLHPLGVQRGTTIDLTLTGTNLADPTGVWTSFPAKVSIPTENNNGKDNAKLLVRLEVPKDAPMGFHSLALATTRGMSNFRLFCIDDLPEVMQGPNNRQKATPQAVPVPCVVVGKVAAEANDYYKITVKAGERVSFEVLGRRLGSAFDPQLTLLDAKTGRELHGGYSNDAPGLQTDPRLTYTFKEAGDYLIEIRDVSYRGGEDFFYRLRIGDFPCATTPLPLAIKRGSKVAVHFAGPTVDGVAPVEITAPTDPLIPSVWVTPKGANGLNGWPVSLALSDLDEVLEQEPNDELAGRGQRTFREKGRRGLFHLRVEKGPALHSRSAHARTALAE